MCPSFDENDPRRRNAGRWKEEKPDAPKKQRKEDEERKDKEDSIPVEGAHPFDSLPGPDIPGE